MPIKDKITPQLKKAFSENIKKTIDTGREHGFYVCSDKEEKLTASRIRCAGSQCELVVERLPEMCPEKIQGFFHTHPQRSLLEKMAHKKFSDKDIKFMVEESRKASEKTGITAHMPSHRDLLTMFITKCDKYSEGTMCTAGDMEPDKVECWTPKRGAANFITCRIAKIDSIISIKEPGIGPRKWIKHLFEKEVIDLNK